MNNITFPIVGEDLDKQLAKFVLEKDISEKQMFGFIDGELKYMKISIEYHGFSNKNLDKAIEFYEGLEFLVKSFNSQADPGVNMCWQVADDNWAWLELQDNVLTSALMGILFGLLFTYCILTLLTRNVVLSLLSILSMTVMISDIVVSIWFMGWTFGYIESTCLIISIGISVDYIVHFSHAYMTSYFQTRR